ncbi:MAG: NEW3 domain-containing protein [Candidatus Hodarchaeota archaeon]
MTPNSDNSPGAATTQTVTVTVTNTGYSPLTNVELLVTSIPSNEWTVEINPLKQTTLNPNEAIYFQVYIRVPAEAARGDYLVELQPSMDQIAAEELESLEIRVTVNPETAWGIYGLALVMVALAVVFLVIMKFRRK